MRKRWFEAFRRDPHEAVSDLFAGRAGVGADMRLDVPELLQQWFPGNMAGDRRCLDDALLRWLREMQRDYRVVVGRIGFPVYGKRVGDALIALQLLDLPQARSAIRADLIAWLRWLSPLRLAPERDPALECYQLLTQAQPGIDHLAMWLRLAADGRPEYLTVALAGLRRLPNDGDARKNQVLMLQALLRHAVVRFHEVDGARHFFNRGYAAVCGLFPRAPQQWKSVLEEVLQGSARDRIATDLASVLYEKQLGDRRSAPSRQSRRRPVPEEEWRALESGIHSSKKPVDALAHRLFDILERNHEYALATGDSYNFVHTLSNLGTKLLERSPLCADDMVRFGVMIERGLVWEPANEYCWMLWAKWFHCQGLEDAQEAVLREAQRLFPRRPAARVELARLLIARGEECWTEAEHYLHHTIDDHPDNGHAHVVTARLLYVQGQRDDAEKTLLDFLERNPNNGVACEALETLRAGTFAVASAAQSDTLEDILENSATRQADSGIGLEAAAGALQEVLRRGGLAGEFNRALISAGASDQTSLIEQESQKGDALAGFYSQWLQLPDTPACPPHAWAWNACLYWHQSVAADAWDALAERFPEAASETHFLRELAGTASLNGSIPQYRASNGTLSRPIDAIVRDGQALLAATDLDQRDRDDFACSLMACAAVNPPEFPPARTRSTRSVDFAQAGAT